MKASTVASVSALLVWMLGAYVFRGVVPLPVEGVVGLVATGGCTFAAGWLARHVNR